MAMVTYPLNNIEYAAEDAELFHSTRTSGVYANNSFNCSVSGADNIVIINTGIGWIKNNQFAGKVVAQKESVSLDLGLPDSNYPRIDAIVIQFDANKNESEIVVKKGTANSNPVAPSVVRTESVYELHLYHIRRDAGALTISAGNITDLRLNANYCGLMADSVTEIDTDSIEHQITELIANLSEEIKKVKDESAFWLKEDVIPLENGGTGATNSEEARENLGAAPAGYGLGETVPQTKGLSEMNNSTPSGWYFVPAENAYNGVRGIAHVSNSGNNLCIINFWDVNDSHVRRKMVDGWGEFEWDNPPMVPGVEYRTTERWNGKAVYAKLVNCGAVTTSGNCDTGITGLDKMVSSEFVNGNIISPYGTSDSGSYFFAYTNGYIVWWKAGTNTASYADTVYALLKYTKTTD